MLGFARALARAGQIMRRKQIDRDRAIGRSMID